MRSVLTIVLVATLAVLAPAAKSETTLERVAARGGLVAAVNPDQLPLAAKDADGTLSGFDIDVAKEIASRLDLPLAFIEPGWDAILAGDWDGAADYAVANITPTEARSEVLDFPAVYRLAAVVVVVRKDDLKVEAPDGVSGKRVGVAKDTTFEKYLKRTLEIYPGQPSFEYLINDPTIVPFPSKSDALQALSQGDGPQVDAVVTDLSTAQAAIASGAPLRIVPGFLFWEPVAVAVEKGDTAFGDRINTVVQAMLADGTLKSLSMKWFGLDLTTLVLQ